MIQQHIGAAESCSLDTIPQNLSFNLEVTKSEAKKAAQMTSRHDAC